MLTAPIPLMTPQILLTMVALLPMNIPFLTKLPLLYVRDRVDKVLPRIKREPVDKMALLMVEVVDVAGM